MKDDLCGHDEKKEYDSAFYEPYDVSHVPYGSTRASLDPDEDEDEATEEGGLTAVVEVVSIHRLNTSPIALRPRPLALRHAPGKQGRTGALHRTASALSRIFPSFALGASGAGGS